MDSILGRQPFTRSRLITGLLLWALQSYILYSLFYVCREAFRFMGGSADAAFILSNSDHFLLNLFFAAIASALGYMLSLNFLLENIGEVKAKRRFIARQTWNTGKLSAWIFLWWFCKLSLILGIWYMMDPMWYDIDFSEDHELFLILLPSVLFLSTWTRLNHILGKDKLKWMGATTLIFSVMSVALASNDILDKEKIDKVLKEQWLTERYQIEVPSTVTFQSEYERIQFIDIYVTESVHLEGNPKLFIESVHGETDISKLADTLTQIRRKIEDWHSPAKCVLHIDKDVPMSAVRNIKEQIRSADIRLLMYSTGLVNNVYPSSHPRLKYVGINEAMAPASQKMIAFLDSAEQLDRSKYRIKLHDSWLYRNGFIKTYNRIRVDVNADTVLLNGRPTTRDELSQVAYEFMKKFSQNGCIIYDVDDDASYEQYIKYLDVLYTAVDKLRREYSLEMYNEPFDEWSEHNSEVNERYPRAIVQWNAEERRLEQLMKNW